MNEQGKSQEGIHFSRRFLFVWSGLYLLSIIVPVLLALMTDGLGAGERTTIITLAFLLVASHLGSEWFHVKSGWEVRYPLWIGLPLMGLNIVALYFLLQISPAFYLFLFGLFSRLFTVLSLRWSAVGALSIAVLIGYQQTIGSGGSFSWPIFLIYLLMGLSSVVLGGWIEAIIRQSEQRQELLEQLRAAQAELATSERRAGVLTERQRLAHEIHDTLAQGFVSVITHLEAALPRLPEDPALVHNVVQAQQAARDGLGQARRVVDALRPAALEEAALPDALRSVAAKWSAQSGVPAAVTITGQIRPLPGDMEVTLLRALQEGLSNVHKHAGARHVQVTLSYMPDVILLDVQDDGAGLQNGQVADPTFSSGYGLIAMRERVALCQGTVELESEPGEGTTLVVAIPLEDDV